MNGDENKKIVNKFIKEKTLHLTKEEIESFKDVIISYTEKYAREKLDFLLRFLEDEPGNILVLYRYYLDACQQEGNEIPYFLFASRYLPKILENIEQLARALKLKKTVFSFIRLTPDGIEVG